MIQEIHVVLFQEPLKETFNFKINYGENPILRDNSPDLTLYNKMQNELEKVKKFHFETATSKVPE